LSVLAKRVKLGIVSWNWVSQFRRFVGYYSDLIKNMSTTEKAGKANPKPGLKLL
jgi:hypothetical protein